MSCANTQNNEATLKAFKIACLSYAPSLVKYEKTAYARTELIQSKQVLMKYCLDQLKHLDLGSIDNIEVSQTKRNVHKIINPKHVPTLPVTDHLLCSSIYSVEGGSAAKPVVVPRLNMAMTAHNRLSISTFNGCDSVSERLHEEKRRRGFVSSSIPSTDFESMTRHHTIDPRVDNNPGSHHSIDHHFMQSSTYSTIGLKSKKNVHILVSADNGIERIKH